MAKHIDVDVSTLYNWRRFKPELFRIVMLGFKFDELIVASKQNYDELCEYDSVIQAEIQRYKIPKKHLRRSITKEVKDLCIDNSKTLMKQINEDTKNGIITYVL